MEEHLYHILQFTAFFGAMLLIIPLLGRYWAHLAEGRIPRFAYWLHGIEVSCYRFSGVDPDEEMKWTAYLRSYLYLTVWCGIVLFLVLIFQGYLPLNPQQFPGVSPITAFNITASFITNTNWQSYVPETTLSYGSQMWGLTVQNFVSAAAGSAIIMPLIRGLTRRSTDTVGNFWADLVRSVVYLLLPLSILFALIYIAEGVIQTLDGYLTIQTVEEGTQTIPLGPVASQVAIKMLGTNGGGFFNANGAHPFENPTSLTNFLQVISIIALPASLVYAYGVMIKSKFHVWLLLGVMFSIWMLGYALAYYSEWIINPIMSVNPVMEGEEIRLRTVNSILWATLTTATANGSINAMMDSMSPLAGGVCLFNMLLGESVFGGVGVGLSSMLMFVLLTVFLCGLMVGRTPEYLGKKLERKEVQWILVAVLTPTILILLGSGVSLALASGREGISIEGPHGLTQVLYAFASSSTNNGSAFSGFRADLNYYQILLGIIMLLGRMAIIVPTLAIAGSFAKKIASPYTVGTLSTNSPMFAFLLVVVILIVGTLTFFPALSLGPYLEHLLMLRGDAFPQASW